MSRRGNCLGGHTPCPQRADGELLRDPEVGGRPPNPDRGHRFETQAELRSALFDHVETFYSTRRRHTSLGFLTPVEHEDRHHQQQALTLAA